MRQRIAEAGLVAAALSAMPSTTHALIRHRDPLEGALAAGSILLPRATEPLPLVVSGTVVHLGLSLGWAAVLEITLPHGRELRWAGVAGLAIAALDLGVVGRRFPRIQALQTGPQVADHLLYALTAGWVLGRRRRGAGAGAVGPPRRRRRD